MSQALVWDNESAVGSWRAGRPKLSEEFDAFRGMLGVKVVQCRPRDPEAKGLVERANGYLETSFLHGRTFEQEDDALTGDDDSSRGTGFRRGDSLTCALLDHDSREGAVDLLSSLEVRQPRRPG